MEIPGIGAFTEDEDLGWYRSEPIPVPVLGATPSRIVLDGYDNDPAQEDFHTAVRAFLALDRSALEAATPSIFAYYRDVLNDVGPDADLHISGPGEVLDHVLIGARMQIRLARLYAHYSADRPPFN
ncbi:hypothetical protein AB0J83_35075 [Actinoplanes sp. NPDC049596]|uniref:DUF6985 domain-containing protein n=1 Tax=unclassified Actinoplanes TaxID=2626549 RepID=UPI0034176BAD